MGSMNLVECGRVLISDDFRLAAFDCLHCKKVETHWRRFLEHTKQCKKFQKTLSKTAISNKKRKKSQINDEPSSDCSGLAESTDQMEVEEVYIKCNDNEVRHLQGEESIRFRAVENIKVEEPETVDLDEYDEEEEFISEFQEVDVNREEFQNAALDEIEYVDENYEISDDVYEEEHIETTGSEAETDNTEDIFSGHDIANNKKTTLSGKGKLFSQTDIPSNTISSTAIEKQSFILSFALTPEHIVRKFIALVKEHRCLWIGPKHRTRVARNHSIHSISDELNITPTSVAKSLQFLLRWYAVQYQKHKDNIMDKTDSILRYFKNCDFLNERMELITEENEKLRQQRATRKKVICQHCGKLIETLRISQHIKQHTKNFDFKCTVCEKLCTNAADLRTHMRVHTGEKPYECKICGKRYKTSSALCSHRRMHEEPSFQCTECSKAFRKMYLLQSHMNTHLNIRPFHCEHCLKTFTSARLLYVHQKPRLRCVKIDKTRQSERFIRSLEKKDEL